MRSERMGARVLAVGLGLVVTVGPVACRAMSNVPNPRAFMVDRPGTHIWVAGPDKQLVELRHATVDDDTLSGFAGSQYYEIAMSDVTRLQASLPSPGRTALAVGGGIVLAGMAVSIMTSEKPGPCEQLVGGSAQYAGAAGQAGSISGTYQPCPTTPGN
jgi:hypothetical protein